MRRFKNSSACFTPTVIAATDKTDPEKVRKPLMSFCLDRRGFLQRSAILGGSLLTCSIPLDRSAHAASVRIDAPVVDQLTVREITDGSHDIFLSGVKVPRLSVRAWGKITASSVPNSSGVE
jgi:hypothetical protein